MKTARSARQQRQTMAKPMNGHCGKSTDWPLWRTHERGESPLQTMARPDSRGLHVVWENAVVSMCYELTQGARNT